MLTLHILGGVIVAVGLTLFWLDQRKGSSGADESHVEVAKVVNLSGPASLVLVLTGMLMFVFPYTSLYTPDDPNPPETVPTTEAPNTTLNNPAVTVTTTVLPELVPIAPMSSFVDFDDLCGEDVLFWNQPEIENVHGWWLSFESYNIETGEVWSAFEIDTGSDVLTLGNVSAICEVDFVEPDVALNWSVWIYAYNSAGYSEPLYVEYADL